MIMSDETKTIIEHLEDLRKVIIVSAVALVAAALIVYFAFRDSLFLFLTEPLQELHVPLIQISIAEAFLTKIKISLLAGLVLAMPIIFWQILSFILPALTAKEKRLVYLLLPGAVLFFVTGIIFSYQIVLRFAMIFFLTGVSEGLTPMISVSKYISFLLSFVIPFGFIFEMPLLSIFLARLGLINAALLASKRKYAILAIFVIAALLTPPDVISQLFMAGPMILLYELSIVMARIFAKKPRPELAEGS